MPSEKQLWGGETAKAVENFPISGETVPVEVVRWLARIKGSAAAVNGELGLLGKGKAKSIERAAAEIAAGKHDAQFPIDVFQTGSGTSTNMNANEVIANLAGGGIHANDHVNYGQSTNDVFPTGMRIGTLLVLETLYPVLDTLASTFRQKAAEFDGIMKSGRTHMQDATPITLGQEWSGYAGMLADNLERIEDALKGVYRLALGGTAVGTGINAAPGFAEAAAAEIAKLTRLPFVSAPNKFTVQGAHDALVQLRARSARWRSRSIKSATTSG